MSDFETHPVGTKAELERLQAQNERLISRGIEDMHDEIERLQAEVTHYAQAFQRERNMNISLRAALERIVEATRDRNHRPAWVAYKWVTYKIAREALREVGDG